MAQSQDTTPQSWRFTCPLAYVLVDGKQIANGEVDLVVKCEVRKSPASTSRHVKQPTVNRHTLMVYVPKEADPKVGPRYVAAVDRSAVSRLTGCCFC